LLGIDYRVVRTTWTAALVLLLLGLVYLIRQTLLIFTIALLLAYLLYPLMDWIDRRLPGRTRMPALAITYLLVIGIVVSFTVFAGSIVADQAAALARQAPALLDRIRQNPAPGPDAVTGVRNQIGGFIVGQLRQHYGEITGLVPQATLRVLSASRNLIYLILIPILSFFILRDGRSIRDSLLQLANSKRAREAADDTLMDIHRLLLEYMRALLLLCCSALVSYAIGFAAMGLPYALLLAAIAFPLEFVPMVGPLTAAVLIVSVSILSGYPHLLVLLAFLGVFRLFQDYVLSPQLMSRGVELHPMLVIFGVLAGGEVGGVAGIFLSVPMLALIRLLYHRLGKVQHARRHEAAPVNA
jgi:predicted PurR-regulated permease PerM